MASEMSRFMWRLTFYQLVMDVDYSRRRIEILVIRLAKT